MEKIANTTKKVTSFGAREMLNYQIVTSSESELHDVLKSK